MLIKLKLNKYRKEKNNKKKKAESITSEILNPNNKLLFDQNPSYNRDNIQKLYETGKCETMIAYVQSKKFSKQRNRTEYVLYNVCTDRDFMSDHVWVYPKVIKNIDHQNITNEMIHSANVIIPEIYRMKKML